jgi:hypothetical protein
MIRPVSGVGLTGRDRGPENGPLSCRSPPTQGELSMLIRLFGFKGTLKIAGLFVVGVMLYSCAKG